MLAPSRATAWSSWACRSRETTWLGAGLHAESELLADVRLHRGVDQRVRADRAGDGAHRHGLAGRLEAGERAVHGERELRQLVAERRRLGVHPVGAADDHRLPVLEGSLDQDLAQLHAGREHQVGGAGQVVAQRSVDEVVAGHAEVDPAGRLVGDALAVGGEEREHFVVALPLDLLHPLGGRDTGPPHVLDGVLGHPAQAHLGLGGEDLHPDPGRVTRLVREDVRHRGQGIAGNHMGQHPQGELVVRWFGRAISRPRSIRAAPTR